MWSTCTSFYLAAFFNPLMQSSSPHEHSLGIQPHAVCILCVCVCICIYMCVCVCDLLSSLHEDSLGIQLQAVFMLCVYVCGWLYMYIQMYLQKSSQHESFLGMHVYHICPHIYIYIYIYIYAHVILGCGTGSRPVRHQQRSEHPNIYISNFPPRQEHCLLSLHAGLASRVFVA
jgi:hypothetical protein